VIEDLGANARWTVYLDGVQAYQVTTTGNGWKLGDTSGYPKFNGFNADTLADWVFDDVAIYSALLAPAELRGLCTLGHHDLSGLTLASLQYNNSEIDLLYGLGATGANGDSVIVKSLTWTKQVANPGIDLTGRNAGDLWDDGSDYYFLYDAATSTVLRTSISEPGTPFDTWAATGTLGPVTFDGDTNGDGVQDGLAFLLGAGNPDDNALGLLPAVSETGGGLVLSFSMRNAANRGTAALDVEHSSDLGIADAWAAVAVPESTPDPQAADVTFVITPNGILNDVVATIQPGEAADGKLFARLVGSE